jgi:chemotaxis protein methyltransferase WspC
MKEIEQLLRQTMGLDVESVGASSLQRSIRLRMKSLGLKTVAEYFERLQSSTAEWRELVESVIVRETWFFRDHEPFSAFSRQVLEQWLPAHPNRQLRLLSLPCSSGEEPYSLAMALLDSGIDPHRFHIDAVDISERALMRGQLGVYGKNSFREKDLGFRSRHFRHTKEGYALNPSVRKQVHFSHGNVLDPDFMPRSGGYDFIFCRNLLIYFDAATRKKALGQIERLLADDGLLFVGPAEQSLVFDQGFVSAGIPMAFACRKPGRAMAQSQPRAGRPARPLKLPPGAPALVPVTPPHVSVTRAAPKITPNEQPGEAASILDEARQLADAGRFAEAAVLCEAHLLAHGASAPAYYLLGLIHDAASDTRAQDCYRKALYLDPNHYHTLLQMALLSQKNGEFARARTFRDRAQRIGARAEAQADNYPSPKPQLQDHLTKSHVLKPATTKPADVAEL